MRAALAFVLIFFTLGALLLGASTQTGGREDASARIMPPPGVVDELRLTRGTQPRPGAFEPGQAILAADVSLQRQLFRGLFSYDEKLKLVPFAAKELPTVRNGGISNDGLVYTIRLREDAKWSDGAPLTAADFEFALKRLLDPTMDAPQASSFFSIKGAEKFNSCATGCTDDALARLRNEVGVRARDQGTLIIVLEHAQPTLPHLLALVAASPVPVHAIKAHGDEWTEPQNLVTNGPFVLKEWVQGERLVLEPNPYWQGRKVQLKRVTIRIIPNPADAFAAYMAGELDAVDVPAASKTAVDGDVALAKQNVQVPSLLSYAYFLNATRPPFDNELVRQAVSMAFDRDAFVAEVQTGSAQVNYSWLPPAMPGHNKALGRQWKFNPEKARQLLAQAGYPGGRGLAPIVYAYPTQDNGSALGPNTAYAEFLQRQLRDNLGITIELRPQPLSVWRQSFFSLDLQVAFLDWSTETAGEPGDMFSEVWTCEEYDGESCQAFAGYNHSHYANPDFDRKFLQAAKEVDPNRRLNLYQEAEKILVDDAPAVFVSTQTRNLLVKPYVRGAVHTALDNLPMESFLDRVSIAR